MTNTLESLTTTAQELAESVREYHFAIATTDVDGISGGQGAPYRNSQALFLAAIKVAYPELSTDSVYQCWLDNFESVAYCAEYVRNNPEAF
jgi:hypothetical protein